MAKFYVLVNLYNGGIKTFYFNQWNEWNAYCRENKNNIRKVIKLGAA